MVAAVTPEGRTSIDDLGFWSDEHGRAFEAIINYGLVNEIVPDKDGLVHAPMKPGLGVEIDFDLIARKKISVLG